MRTGTLGIIGFGRFGQLAARYLRGFVGVAVHDVADRSGEAASLGVRWAPLAEAAACDIVVFSVPISSLAEALEQAAPHLARGALVLDVCSVKEEPVEAMRRLVPERCSCIATHPLFGPDSAAASLEGKRIAVCPVRVRPGELERFIALARAFGIVPDVVDPAEHDRQMAHSLNLIHFLGKSLEDIDVEGVTLTTPTHDLFLRLVAIVRNDSHQLMLDMHRHNRFASTVRRDLIRDMQRIDREIEDGTAGRTRSTAAAAATTRVA